MPKYSGAVSPVYHCEEWDCAGSGYRANLRAHFAFPTALESFMHSHRITALGITTFAIVLGAGPLAAQDNPFAFTGGAVKSAYIVYDVTSKDKQGPGSSYEVAVAPDRWIMKMKS